MDAYDKIMERIEAEMDKGEIPWKKPWVGGVDAAVSYMTGKPYSLVNQILTGIPGEYLTFNQVRQLGGKVRKGEKATTIIFWKVIPGKTTDADGEIHEKQIPYLRYYNVFHISQCEGIESKMLENPAPVDSIDAAENLIKGYVERSGVKLVTVPGSKQAYYSPMDDTVIIPDKSQYSGNIAEYYSTVFHELVHSTGSKSRLNRLNTGKLAAFGSEDYSKEELTAEIGASAILNYLGIETDSSVKNNAGYLQGWLKALRSDRKMLVGAASRAEKAVNMIFGKSDEEENK